ncbi:MAG: hypothetical protein P9M13_07495 [Candidatus Ancaeobacter aquaticus]|nr:hypothetical protein [Candidatus Ancaeobacter aquaticus]
MRYLFGSVVTVIEVIAIGALLKIGYHTGKNILENCGEKESKYSKTKVKGGKKRVFEKATGNELSIFPG